jgi:ribosomal-protein-alanine N-acetyltransferase
MLQLDTTEFPILDTPRVILRPLTLEDADTILFLRSDIRTIQYLDRDPMRSILEAREHIAFLNAGFLNSDCIIWGIELKATGKLIGTIAYHRLDKPHYRAELGYMIHPDYWRKGYMSEVLKMVIDYGFQAMRCHTLEAQVNPHNMASIQILQKFNFVREAYFKENYLYNGQFLDSAVYTLHAPNG